MADLYNKFPSWGETGDYPVDGFFYEGGDQVNEKHLDALWNGVQEHITNLNDGIRDRVRDITGNVVLDQGLVASQGSGTREVDVTASTAGAYVNGQKTGSTSATTLTHTANGGSSTRTDVVWVNIDGSVGKTEGSTTTTADRKKLAEVDVEPDDTISAVRNYGRDHRFLIATENTPESAEPGDLWHDLTAVREKVRQGGAWRTIITEQDDVTISGGDGLKNGNTIDLVGGGTLSLDIEPADFAGHGLEDDGNDNLRIDGADLGAGIAGGDGTNLTLDESVIKDGGSKEIDVAEFGSQSGSSGQAPVADGSGGVDWAPVGGAAVSEDGTEVLASPDDINYTNGLTVTDDGDNTASIDADEANQAHGFVMGKFN
jgi:hypothetical protein